MTELDDLATQGWLLNNCYQHDDGTFRVNARRPTPTGAWFTQWAEGPTLADALADCMSKLLDAEFTTNPTTLTTIEPTLSLTERLGLHRAPSPPIKRRF